MMFVKTILDVQEFIDNEGRVLGAYLFPDWGQHLTVATLAAVAGAFVGGGERAQQEDEAKGEEQSDSHDFCFN